MVDLNLFRIPQFSLNLFTATLTFVAISGIVLLLPFYLELVMRLQLRDVGLMMAIVPLVMVALQPLSGFLSDRLGTRPVSMVGLVFIFFGYLTMATLPVGGTPLGFLVRMLPVAIGMATFNSPNNSAIMGAVPRQRLGVASGLLGMMRTLGQVTGIAVLGAFFASRVAYYAGASESLRAAPPTAIVAALHDQFLLVAGLILVGIVVAGLHLAVGDQDEATGTAHRDATARGRISAMNTFLEAPSFQEGLLPQQGDSPRSSPTPARSGSGSPVTTYTPCAAAPGRGPPGIVCLNAGGTDHR